MFKNITVAVDGSEHSWKALAAACDLAKHYSADIHLVHTPEMLTTGIAVGAGAIEIAPTNVAVAEAGAAIMAEAATKARNAGIDPVTQDVKYGTPSTEALRIAEETGSDLIVTGRRGVGSLHGLLLGSTSQQIAHHAKCAVLTVK
ncbi:MAG: universal stress protein [Pseudomonadota bacterium]